MDRGANYMEPGTTGHLVRNIEQKTRLNKLQLHVKNKSRYSEYISDTCNSLISSRAFAIHVQYYLYSSICYFYKELSSPTQKSRMEIHIKPMIDMLLVIFVCFIITCKAHFQPIK